MDDTQKTLFTATEKQEKRIEQLKSQLQKETARLSAVKRKDRNGQLISFGLYVEALYKCADLDVRKKIQTEVSNLLEGRTADRARAGFSRLDEEISSQRQDT